MNWLEFISASFEALAWPVAVGFSVWILREEVRKSFSRVVSVGPDGIKLHPLPQQLPKQNEDEVEKLANKELYPLKIEYLAELENRYRADLDVFPKEARENVLLRALTNQTYYKDLALIYADIYSLQIDALEMLNTRNVSKVDAQVMLEESGKRIPFYEGAEIEKFMQFLLLTNLVIEDGGSYIITQKGRDFLTFLSAMGLSKRRPL